MKKYYIYTIRFPLVESMVESLRFAREYAVKHAFEWFGTIEGYFLWNTYDSLHYYYPSFRRLNLRYNIFYPFSKVNPVSNILSRILNIKSRNIL